MSEAAADDRWVVGTRSPKIPGGYRVVKVVHGEEAARRLAASYKRPHLAMPYSELIQTRLAALDALRSPPAPLDPGPPTT